MHSSDNLFMRKFFFLAGILTLFSFAALGQSQLILDGDFESPNFSVWTISGTGATIATDAAGALSGSHYLTMGHVATAQAQTAYQTISIPSNAVSVTLSYYLDILSPGSSAVDQFQVVLRRTSDGSLLAPIDFRRGDDPGHGSYRHFIFDLTAYAGQTVFLSFEAFDSVSGSGTVFNVDDVSVLLEL